ncbi:MAG: c-type cytochrome, partial [Planctomycetota bacterium]
NRDAFEELYEMAESQSTDVKRDVVLGTARALAGWVRELEPDKWSDVAGALKADAEKDKELATALQYLSVLFGDGQTMDKLKAIAADEKASLELRKSALQSLVDAKAFGTEDLCEKLLNKRFLNLVAAKGLANSERPDVSGMILKNYRRFHPSERSQVISLLASRASWAENLLNAIQRNQILREELSPYQARQIASHEKPRLSQLLADTWGRVRASSAEKQALKAKLKEQLSQDFSEQADKSAGRALFTKSCSKCHTLFGAGGKLGPDLTGAQRSNLDYLLDNIVDPSAVVTKEFRATLIRTEDDRVITGLVTEKNENVVTIATQDEVYKIAREEIAQMKSSENSTMPDGLLDQLTAEQIRDLIAYLQSTQQVE